jgi:hypothetical protein
MPQERIQPSDIGFDPLRFSSFETAGWHPLNDISALDVDSGGRHGCGSIGDCNLESLVSTIEVAELAEERVGRQPLELSRDTKSGAPSSRQGRFEKALVRVAGGRLDIVRRDEMLHANPSRMASAGWHASG